MKVSHTRYAFLALVAVTFLYTSCQKATSRPVRGQLGQTKPAQDSQDEQKLDELIKAGLSLQTCTAAIQEKYKALTTQIDAAMGVVRENTDKQISAEISKSLKAYSNQIKALGQALSLEFLSQKVSACGSGSDQISLKALRETLNESFLAIAKVLGEDTPESAAVKQNKKSQDAVKTAASLSGQKLQPAPKLLAVLDERNQQKFLFVVNAQIANKKEDYQKTLDSDAGVCLLEKAPQQKLKEGAILTVLRPVITSTEVVTEESDQKVTQKRTLQLLVPMSSGDQVLSFNCRLAKELKEQSASEQFFKIFGSLLTVVVAK